MKKTSVKYRKLLMRCGTIGCCIENICNACNYNRQRNWSLKGVTGLWMVPIYGLAYFSLPIYKLIKKQCCFVRGCIYTIGIFTIEFISGFYLKSKKICPWSYQKSGLNINGVIRLDYAPFWFIESMFYETILRKLDKKSDEL